MGRGGAGRDGRGGEERGRGRQAPSLPAVQRAAEEQVATLCSGCARGLVWPWLCPCGKGPQSCVWAPTTRATYTRVAMRGAPLPAKTPRPSRPARTHARSPSVPFGGHGGGDRSHAQHGLEHYGLVGAEGGRHGAVSELGRAGSLHDSPQPTGKPPSQTPTQLRKRS
jgi:hypothetical protein